MRFDGVYGDDDKHAAVIIYTVVPKNVTPNDNSNDNVAYLERVTNRRAAYAYTRDVHAYACVDLRMQHNVAIIIVIVSKYSNRAIVIVVIVVVIVVVVIVIAVVVLIIIIIIVAVVVAVVVL